MYARLPMAPTPPWRITVTAVEQYLDVRGWRDDAEGRERAERELQAIALDVMGKQQPGRPLDTGATQYRGPRPLRLRLTVTPPSGGEPLPQLVRVQPAFEGRS
jgi:hypothetical protein